MMFIECMGLFKSWLRPRSNFGIGIGLSLILSLWIEDIDIIIIDI